jgi:nicotinate-nucleotide pyrophosphorylase
MTQLWSEALQRQAEELLRAALAEDVGDGDWTTLWTVGVGERASATIDAQEDLVLAGVPLVRMVFLSVDPSLGLETPVSDGALVERGAPVFHVRGSARSILTAERTALNFLGRLSGIATLTRHYVEQVAGTGTQIVDTRKTTPGWRHLEKWAVRMGGGLNHRIGLHDMVLVKDNQGLYRQRIAGDPQHPERPRQHQHPSPRCTRRRDGSRRRSDSRRFRDLRDRQIRSDRSGGSREGHPDTQR